MRTALDTPPKTLSEGYLNATDLSQSRHGQTHQEGCSIPETREQLTAPTPKYAAVQLPDARSRSLSLIHPFDKTPISTAIQQTPKSFLRMQVEVFKQLLYHLMK